MWENVENGWNNAKTYHENGRFFRNKGAASSVIAVYGDCRNTYHQRRNLPMKSEKVKKILSSALVAAMCMAPGFALAGEYATVKGGGLNLRQTASLEAAVLGQYGTGTWVEILEEGDTWCKVQVAGKTGYMMKKYLNKGASSDILYVRTNTGIGLNLRYGPSTASGIITSFPIDTPVTILQRGNGWHKVSVNGQQGYMSSKYLVARKAPQYTKPVPSPFTASLKNINGGSVVNFRLYPGMKTKILKVVPVGTQVTVIEMGENWSKVILDGQEGYVSTYFLKY